MSVASNNKSIKVLLPANQPSSQQHQPILPEKTISGVFYAVGGVAGLIWALAVYLAPTSYQGFFEVKNFLPLLALVVSATVCNWFPFRVPPNLYVTLSMLLYFTAYVCFAGPVALIVPVIASVIFELYVVKRGSAFAARTAGMYVIATLAARWVYELLGGGDITTDLTLSMILPVLVSFAVFRFLNEAVVWLTQYLQGYGIWTFRNHITGVTATYLACVPAALLLAATKTNIGPILFCFGCLMVIVTGYNLNRATTARDQERTQLALVKELNEKLEYQNTQQSELGNRINLTLDSFLTLVRDYAETSQEQEAAVMDITSTIEELSRTASQIAATADNVSNAADRTLEAAESGQQAVGLTIEAITDVQTKVHEIALKISDLTQKAERIGEIVTVINAIAGEIRLLALNATIEASGAGQFGKRFAIVANEVNQLADRSREALQQIKQIISEIQTATVSSRRVTEDGLQRMEKSVEMASRSEKANREIINSVQKTTSAAAAISLATQQQRSASEQVVANVHDVAIMIGQNAEKVASVSVASMELQRVARELTAEE
jgi:methyl-accepting chemotaxis protein